MFIQVCPLLDFDDEGLTYSIDEGTEIPLGSIVEVPFGRQKIDAVVIQTDIETPSTDIKKLKK